MNSVEAIQHPTWGRIASRDGKQWELEERADWPGIGSILVRFCFDDPDHPQTHVNHLAMKAHWAELWPRIVHRTEAMRESYGCQDEAIDLRRDYFEVSLPKEPFEASPPWSVMLQTASGWLLDFEGWKDAGGQGVF